MNFTAVVWFSCFLQKQIFYYIIGYFCEVIMLLLSSCICCLLYPGVVADEDDLSVIAIYLFTQSVRGN